MNTTHTTAPSRAMHYMHYTNKPIKVQPIPERAVGPYASCGACPYAAHGKSCSTREGDCMRTDMERINRRRTV